MIPPAKEPPLNCLPHSVASEKKKKYEPVESEVKDNRTKNGKQEMQRQDLTLQSAGKYVANTISYTAFVCVATA